MKVLYKIQPCVMCPVTGVVCPNPVRCVSEEVCREWKMDQLLHIVEKKEVTFNAN